MAAATIRLVYTAGFLLSSSPADSAARVRVWFRQASSGAWLYTEGCYEACFGNVRCWCRSSWRCWGTTFSWAAWLGHWRQVFQVVSVI